MSKAELFRCEELKTEIVTTLDQYLSKVAEKHGEPEVHLVRRDVNMVLREAMEHKDPMLQRMALSNILLQLKEALV